MNANKPNRTNSKALGSFVVVSRGGWSTIGKRGHIVKIDGDVATIETPYGELVVRNLADIDPS